MQDDISETNTENQKNESNIILVLNIEYINNFIYFKIRFEKK